MDVRRNFSDAIVYVRCLNLPIGQEAKAGIRFDAYIGRIYLFLRLSVLIHTFLLYPPTILIATSSWILGVAACALVFGVLFGVAGLIMTITGANDANIAPAEVLEAELGEVGSPLLDIIGPVFLGVGVASLIAGVSMCMYARYPTRRGQAARAAANRGNAGWMGILIYS